jgi:hypothetical protein
MAVKVHKEKNSYQNWSKNAYDFEQTFACGSVQHKKKSSHKWRKIHQILCKLLPV